MKLKKRIIFLLFAAIVLFLILVICVVPANESTRRRLTFYTLTEYLAFAVASGLQVVYIRRLFSKSVAYNRV